MEYLWVFIGFVAYAGGLVIITRLTPILITHPYDDPTFMGASIVDVIGGILAFIGILLPFALFSGGLFVRFIDFFLLMGLLLISARTGIRSFRAGYGTYRFSRIFASSYGLLLFIASLYCLILLFVPTP